MQKNNCFKYHRFCEYISNQTVPQFFKKMSLMQSKCKMAKKTRNNKNYFKNYHYCADKTKQKKHFHSSFETNKDPTHQLLYKPLIIWSKQDTSNRVLLFKNVSIKGKKQTTNCFKYYCLCRIKTSKKHTSFIKNISENKETINADVPPVWNNDNRWC